MTYQGMRLQDLAGRYLDVPSPEEEQQQVVDVERQQFAEAVAVCQRLTQSLKEALELMAVQHQQWTEQAPQALTEVALLLAERVVDHELSINPDIVRGCAEAALRETTAAGEKILRLHPEDIALLKAHSQESWNTLSSMAGVCVQEDAALSRGGCQLHLPTYQIDAGISRRLEYLWKTLASKAPPAREAPVALADGEAAPVTPAPETPEGTT